VLVTARGFTGVVLNYAATVGVILVAYWYYTSASRYHIGLLNAQLRIRGIDVRFRDVLFWCSVFYAVALVPYYVLLPEIQSKSRIACTFVFDILRKGREVRFGVEQKQALLTLSLKAFFIPLMVNWLIANTADVVNHWHEVMNAIGQPQATFFTVFNQGLFLLLLKLLMMVDVFLFTVGYMLELPVLSNQIKSVDPTASGWLVCLLCYPPFNQSFGQIFPWDAADFPSFSQPAIHVAMNCGILLAMGVYAWASFALGWRASNLTNRGIVASGPYAWVRHPAYIGKNLAWWIGGLPIFAIQFNQSFAAGLWALVCLSVWSGIYVLRATTEERHLLMINNGYAEYMRRVRWRFIPGVV